jgi:two-component system, cell cycle sensor histidine kinase and response regulator CckA
MSSSDSHKELELRNKIANIFLTVPDDEMYSEVLQVILESFESKYGFFGYIDVEGSMICPSLTQDIWDKCQVQEKNYIFPKDKWGSSIWGRAIVKKKTLYSNTELKIPEGHIPITRVVCVPIIYHGKTIGIIGIGNKETDYKKIEIDLLEIIASKIAPILDARLKHQFKDKEHIKTVKKLDDSLNLYKTLFDKNPDCILFADIDTKRFIYCNESAFSMFGYTEEEFKKLRVLDIHPEESLPHVLAEFNSLANKEKTLSQDIPCKRKDATIFYADINTISTLIDRKKCNIGFFRDVTRRKHAEDRKLLSVEILEELNRTNNFLDVIKNITSLIKKHLDFEAIGIRLKEGSDFPYFITKGFPSEFINADNYLCSKDNNDSIKKDSQGNPYLECMCGIVLNGKTNPEYQFYTEKGSLWTNDTDKLLSTTNEIENQGATRNFCNSFGYLSVALIPLRSQDKIIGLLQLNDKRSNMFTLELVNFLESLGSSIGITLSRFIEKKEQEENEVRYKELFESTNHSVAIYKATDNGNDFVFVDVNRILEKVEKVKKEDILGKSVREVFPGVVDFGLFDVFKKVWLTGKNEYQPVKLYKDGRIEGWKENFVYKLPSGEVVAVYRDVTEQVKAEENKHKSEATLRSILRVAPIGIGLVSERTFKWVNEKYCEIIGYKEDEIIDKSVRLLYSDQNEFERIGKVHEELIKSKDSVAIETQWIRKDGRLIDVLLSLTPLDPDDLSKGMTFTALDITGRKKVEKALKESEVTLSSIFKVAPIGIGLISNRVNIWVNQRLCEMTGYDREEIIGKSALILYPDKEEFDRVGKVKYNQIKLQGTGTIETRWKRKDGKIIDVLLSSTPLEPTDHSKGVTFTALDITERKNAESALQKSEERFKDISFNIGEWIWEIDKNGYFTYSSGKVKEILGYEPEELYSKTPIDLLITEEADKIKERFKTLSSQKKPIFDSENWNLTKDGKKICLQTNAVPILNEKGELIGYRGVDKNITDRKLAEEALKRSEMEANLARKEWEETFNSIDYIIAIVDPLFRIIRINDTGKKLLEVTDDKIINQTCFGVFLDLKEPCENCPSKRTIFDHKPHTAIIEHKNLNKIFLVSSSPIIQNGDLKAIIHTSRDITEQNKMESQLRQALKMESVGTLAGGVAHDFNNLLQAIMGYSELLLIDKTKKDQDYNKLKEIYLAAHKGSDLTRQLLTFSRKVESILKPTNLNILVQQARKLLERTIPKMISINLMLSEDLLTVEADPNQIEHILLNLASNSRDSMPEGGEIHIKTQNVILDEDYCKTHMDVEPGVYVMLIVSDSGCGMDEKTLKQIYDPFFTTKEPGKGTGLGLSSVYGIVKNHHGHINCYSEIGVGTTFKIYFPTIEKSSDYFVDQQEDIQLYIGSENILVVDDEVVILSMCQELLERNGYKVFTASDGASALDIYEKKKDQIELVVLDLNMPGLSGEKCLREFKRIDQNVKVIISSGYALNGSATTYEKLGAKGFINKPYNMRELLRIMRKALDKN